MKKGDTVTLLLNIAAHAERKSLIKAGTVGEVLATRHTETDSEPQALVKFKGWAGPRSLAQRLLNVPVRVQATLALKLVAETGYECEEEHRIDLEQWKEIQRILNTKGA